MGRTHAGCWAGGRSLRPGPRGRHGGGVTTSRGSVVRAPRGEEQARLAAEEEAAAVAAEEEEEDVDTGVDLDQAGNYAERAMERLEEEERTRLAAEAEGGGVE